MRLPNFLRCQADTPINILRVINTLKNINTPTSRRQTMDDFSLVLQFFHHLSRVILKKLKKILKIFKNCVALLKKICIFAIGNKI